MKTYKIATDYQVISNTDKETKIIEVEKHIFNDYVSNYMRELVIKKDRAIMTTWLNALDDIELLSIYNILKDIMTERGLK